MHNNHTLRLNRHTNGRWTWSIEEKHTGRTVEDSRGTYNTADIAARFGEIALLAHEIAYNS